VLGRGFIYALREVKASQAFELSPLSSLLCRSATVTFASATRSDSHLKSLGEDPREDSETQVWSVLQDVVLNRKTVEHVLLPAAFFLLDFVEKSLLSR
jgi:hypothetical protein